MTSVVVTYEITATSTWPRAPRLRRHFTETFPAGIELAREEWAVLASWPAAIGTAG